MIKIYLVRHGKAETEEKNPYRPLTKNGKTEVVKVAVELKKRKVKVDHIWHSGKLRAEETAKIISEHLAQTGIVRKKEGLRPMDDPTPIKKELEESADQYMLVGHLPFLSRLASLLLTGDPDKETVEFAAGACVSLSKKDFSWKINWIISPKIIGR